MIILEGKKVRSTKMLRVGDRMVAISPEGEVATEICGISRDEHGGWHIWVRNHYSTDPAEYDTIRARGDERWEIIPRSAAYR